MVPKIVFTFPPGDATMRETLRETYKADAELVFENCGRDEKQIISAAVDADAVIPGGMQPFTRNVISQLTKCKIIATGGNGYDGFDVKAATDYAICFSNNPYQTLDAVSDHAMALLLDCARQTPRLDKAVKAGEWHKMPTGTGYIVEKILSRIVKLRDKTLGLIGFGNIPRTLVPKAKGFGLRIIAHDPYVAPELAESFGVEMVDLDKLLRESDFVSVHTALTPESRHLLGLEEFKKMKPTAYLINTARGTVVDERALCQALAEGYIVGAALDVAETEPLPLDSPLLKMENVVLTPHISGFSERLRIQSPFRWSMEEVLRVLKGQWPRALVNPEVKEKFVARWRT